MELIGKKSTKNLMGFDNFYLSIKFMSGEIKEIEVSRKTFINEEYDKIVK